MSRESLFIHYSKIENTADEKTQGSKSLNFTEDLISKLKEIVPGAFTEDKLNIDQPKQLSGDSIHTNHERYQLNWAGKMMLIKYFNHLLLQH